MSWARILDGEQFFQNRLGRLMLLYDGIEVIADGLLELGDKRGEYRVGRVFFLPEDATETTVVVGPGGKANALTGVRLACWRIGMSVGLHGGWLYALDEELNKLVGMNAILMREGGEYIAHGMFTSEGMGWGIREFVFPTVAVTSIETDSHNSCSVITVREYLASEIPQDDDAMWAMQNRVRDLLGHSRYYTKGEIISWARVQLDQQERVFLKRLAANVAEVVANSHAPVKIRREGDMQYRLMVRGVRDNSWEETVLVRNEEDRKRAFDFLMIYQMGFSNGRWHSDAYGYTLRKSDELRYGGGA